MVTMGRERWRVRERWRERWEERERGRERDGKREGERERSTFVNHSAVIFICLFPVATIAFTHIMLLMQSEYEFAI